MPALTWAKNLLARKQQERAGKLHSLMPRSFNLANPSDKKSLMDAIRAEFYITLDEQREVIDNRTWVWREKIDGLVPEVRVLTSTLHELDQEVTRQRQELKKAQALFGELLEGQPGAKAKAEEKL